LKQLITYIGLDVHKETIAVALAEASKRSDVREYGKIANTPAAVKTLVAKLARNGHKLRFCYEAGPCGYGIQRQLTALEHDLHRSRPLADPPQTWRADQDRSARCDQPRQVASGW
jgi:transposase